jgi:hypothetical protein
MARRICLLFLVVASPLILILFLMPWTYSDVIFAILVMGYPVALIVVAVGRSDGVGGLGVVLFILFVLYEVSALGMYALRGFVMEAPWIGGLPLAAAIQLYGLWLMPLLVVPLAYALTFDRFEMTPEDLVQLQRFKKTPEERP